MDPLVRINTSARLYADLQTWNFSKFQIGWWRCLGNQAITSVIRISPLRTLNVRTTFHDNRAHIIQDISHKDTHLTHCGTIVNSRDRLHSLGYIFLEP